MATAPLTPGEDPEPSTITIDYSPDNVPYDEEFEDEIMKAILYPSVNRSHPPPPSKTDNLVFPSSLPLPLNSQLRTHPSPVPGIFLTHANGYHTGGPGPSPDDVAAFGKQFVIDHSITTTRDLTKKVEEAIKVKIAEARERLVAREEAILRNESVRKDIKNLEVQRQAEERVEERVRRDRERKRGRG